jgi:hypothetical protein
MCGKERGRSRKLAVYPLAIIIVHISLKPAAKLDYGVSGGGWGKGNKKMRKEV